MIRQLLSTIGSATDIDYYTFDATAGTDIRVNVYATGDPMDPVIEIRDPNGIVVVNGVADGAACGGICTFSVDLSPEVTGTCNSLLIYDSNIDEPGSYELSIWCLFGPVDPQAPNKHQRLNSYEPGSSILLS